MTEQEWLDCTEPMPMLEFIHPTASHRKLRLFAFACSRLVWHLLRHDWSRDALCAVERYLEGNLTRFEAAMSWEVWTNGLRAWGTEQQAMVESGSVQRDSAKVAHSICTLLWAVQLLNLEEERNRGDSQRKPLLSAEMSMIHASKALALASGEVDRFPDRLVASGVPFAASELIEPLRDIFNPFRHLTFDTGSLTPPSASLANAVYEERIMPRGYLDPNRLAVLSETLEETGCDAAILKHMRSSVYHVRGCWALDLILGRE